MIADEESEVSSPVESNGTKQLHPPGAGSNPTSKDTSLKPSTSASRKTSAELSLKLNTNASRKTSGEDNDSQKPQTIMETDAAIQVANDHVESSETNENLKQWIANVGNVDVFADSKEPKEKPVEMTTIYIPNVGVISVDAVSDV